MKNPSNTELVSQNFHQLRVKPEEFLANFLLGEEPNGFEFGKVFLGRIYALYLV